MELLDLIRSGSSRLASVRQLTESLAGPPVSSRRIFNSSSWRRRRSWVAQDRTEYV